MNYPSLQGFRQSLICRVNTASRVRKNEKRKNYQREFDRLVAIECIVLLDKYIKDATKLDNEQWVHEQTSNDR